jgi:hypothetical protein
LYLSYNIPILEGKDKKKRRPLAEGAEEDFVGACGAAPRLSSRKGAKHAKLAKGRRKKEEEFTTR